MRADEPTRHAGWLTLTALVALTTAPYLFLLPGLRSAELLGLPAWLVSSVTATLLLSGLIAWGLRRYWKEDEDA